MKQSKCWKSELRSETTICSVVALVVFAIAFFLDGENLWFSILVGSFVVPIVLLRTIINYCWQHKLPASIRYRQPLVEVRNIVVLEKHIHMHPKTLYLKEWLIFELSDKTKIKVYSSAHEFGQGRRHLATFSVGDRGTLYYRKGKRFDSFEEFVHEGVVAEEHM